MNSTIQRVLFAAAVATIGAGAVGTASAQTSSAPASSAPGAAQHGRHGHHHFGGQFVGTLLRATKQLNLTAQQQSQIKTILEEAHPKHQAGTQPEHPAMTSVGNPADAGYASAVQSAQANATTRIQKETALQAQIYGVLNSTQKSQLPTVLAAMQAKEQARHAQWAAQHPAASG